MPLLRVDTAWFPQRVSIDAEFRDERWSGTLSVAERTARLESLRSIWYRSPTAFTFAEGMSPTERRWAMTEAKLGLADLRGVEATTHQFQRWVPKSHEARVIVVGDSVFAAAIQSGSAEAHIDWRNDYQALTYRRVDPPTGVVAGVRGYCRDLGLVYGAFDFVVRPDGQWVFLECNAGGQYGWLEDAAGLPITTALADFLADGCGA
ncbi:hypothetical protein Aglo03_24240 [Actinokineospora globicatena]|uniref:MvdD-like pre-ATP grasp domain-containing protein n=1 Tax=Actinokineospora globicatena TaxID=103729 RepID=A0A9W6VA42_9PSEU|nr:hypothetical protein Aglo03_24240 [Actinokineospora globicatena]